MKEHSDYKDMHPNMERYIDKYQLKKTIWNKVVAIDFDATVHKHITKNSDWTAIADDPITGSREALLKLKSDGWFITIHTARVIDKATYESVKNWLEKYEIPYDEIWTHTSKPYADIYIDDRCITFKGNWEETLDDIKNFKTWKEI